MNNYRLQYWLYAIVAKHLGPAVEIRRDPLHSRFEVNRHGMILTSKSIPVSVMEKKLREILLASGYQPGAYDSLTKLDGNKRPTISLDVRESLSGDVELHIYPHVY